MPQENAFLGRGWSFPPSFSKPDKSVKMFDADADIESCIAIILSTEIGERVMQPAFGWKRDRWIFESLWHHHGYRHPVGDRDSPDRI